MMPCREVTRILERAYPCHGFDGACEELRWDPRRGHVPRGYGGATGTPDDVRLVLVMSEPGEPEADESFTADATPVQIIGAVCRRTYLALSEERDQYHRNLRHILGLIFPGTGLEQQMRRTWITRSVLCSASAAGDMPAAASRECRIGYLERQLELFAGARVVALGVAAGKRLKGHPGLLEAGDPAPPGCHQRGARESWTDLSSRF